MLSSKKTVLTTGFQAFAGDSINPTQLYVEQKHVAPHAVVLPVAYSSAYKILKKNILTNRPQKIFLLGLAKNRFHISLETSAYNETSTTISDELNYTPITESIRADAPTSLVTNFNSLELISNELIKVSNDPGRFLCNFIYYSALFDFVYTKYETEYQPQIIFIHIPGIKEMGAEYLNKEILFKKLDMLISHLCSID